MKIILQWTTLAWQGYLTACASTKAASVPILMLGIRPVG